MSQDPCIVAGWLISPCLTDPFEAEVPGLYAGLGPDYYPPPGSTSDGFTATDCACNTVLYSLLSACAVCQSMTYVSWTSWEAFCSKVYVASYPDNIPSFTSVPQWAYLDVTKANNFSVSDAQALVAKDLPDVTTPGGTSLAGSQRPAPSTATGIAVSPTSAPTVNPFSIPSDTFSFSIPSDTFSFSIPSESFTFGGSNPTSLPSSFTSSKKKKTNVGAIVGGIVGGVTTFFAGLWGWIAHRKRKHAAPGVSAASGAPSIIPSTPDPEKPVHGAASPMGHSPAQDPALDPQFVHVPHLPMNARLYDPDDPSTYPDAQTHVPPPTHSSQDGASGTGSYVPTQY
ncbi:hypothetical protein PHLCEN_2v3112 [Hermanssonia centrifuga]|uniref:Transmembrane protein n=1 Tax=Hermanssonia centrifuga TaxID=98765 RepID=A0A2R6R3W3_9APHY|nr:hypothetical protein PHLCEN_2v3112 [Hermanssonia centrifuga]